MSQEEPFAGFSLPNAIPVPEELWGLLPDLGGAELKVLLFLFRKTLGFQKREDAVALSQITAGTGLSRPTVVEAIRKLQKRGCLKVQQTRTREGDRDTNVYAPRFRTEGEGVVKKVNHPLKESYRGVVNGFNRHDISAAAEDGDFLRFLENHFGRALTADEMAQIWALEAEGIPEETIREGIRDAFRCRRRADASPTLKDCLRVVRRRHRRHHPEEARTLPATGGLAGAAGCAAGEVGDAPSPAAPGTPGVPAPREVPWGLYPAVAEPLPFTDDPLKEVWAALAECGWDTPPLRRGLRLLAEKHSPDAVYGAVVEALAYRVRGERLLGYVRRVLGRRAADAGEEETADAGEEPETEDAEGLTGQGLPSDRVRDDVLSGSPEDTPEGIWKRALGLLELELTRATFSTWLAPSRCVGWEGEVLLVEVANGYARDWLESRLRGVVERALARVVGRPVTVRFVVEGEVVDG